MIIKFYGTRGSLPICDPEYQEFGGNTTCVAVYSEKDGSMLINPHSHPGGAHGYRLEVEGKAIVFCTDIEHGEFIDQSVVNLARDADLLIHEAQYTPEELPKYRGWGYSSWQQAIEVAEQAGVKQLYLTHHDPDHDDVFLKEVELKCQQRFPNCYLAREGHEIYL